MDRTHDLLQATDPLAVLREREDLNSEHNLNGRFAPAGLDPGHHLHHQDLGGLILADPIDVADETELFWGCELCVADVIFAIT